MKPFVITIKNHEDSEKLSNRCVETGKNIGKVEVNVFEASSPKDKPFEVFKDMNISVGPKMYENSQRRCIESQCACFLSHYRLWEKSLELNENILVLEHDSVFTGVIPDINFKYLVNLAKPFYGMKRYKMPSPGLQSYRNNKLFGTHGYAISPAGAKRLIEHVKKHGVTAAVDNFLTFRWMEEYYPWPIEANSYFSTIQFLADNKALKELFDDTPMDKK
jgi:glycosyl transferase family 25